MSAPEVRRRAAKAREAWHTGIQSGPGCTAGAHAERAVSRHAVAAGTNAGPMTAAGQLGRRAPTPLGEFCLVLSHREARQRAGLIDLDQRARELSSCRQPGGMAAPPAARAGGRSPRRRPQRAPAVRNARAEARPRRAQLGHRSTRPDGNADLLRRDADQAIRRPAEQQKGPTGGISGKFSAESSGNAAPRLSICNCPCSEH